MIKIDKLRITITNSDCPNLSYQFDFSGFYNKNLARECIRLLKQKHEQGVSITYLRVLSTAFVHYDNYLKTNNHSRKFAYSDNERGKYTRYLNTINNDSNSPYSKRYLYFLSYVPTKLINMKKNNETD